MKILLILGIVIGAFIAFSPVKAQSVSSRVLHATEVVDNECGGGRQLATESLESLSCLNLETEVKATIVR